MWRFLHLLHLSCLYSIFIFINASRGVCTAILSSEFVALVLYLNCASMDSFSGILVSEFDVTIYNESLHFYFLALLSSQSICILLASSTSHTMKSFLNHEYHCHYLKVTAVACDSRSTPETDTERLLCISPTQHIKKATA
jgi:hypothetical protein